MSIDPEGRSADIDKQAAQDALAKLEPLLGRLPDYPPAAEIVEGLPDTTGELAEDAIDEYDEGDGAINFVQALLIAAGREIPAPCSEHDGDLAVEAEESQARVHHGSLVVKGSLDLHCNLIVLGDLHVDGCVRDVVTWTRLIVTGALRCAAIHSGGPVWVGGVVRAKLTYLGHHGKLFCGGGIDGQLIVSSPEAEGIDGEVRTTEHSTVEEWKKDQGAAMQRLSDLIVPEAMNDNGGGFFVPDELIRRAVKGEPFLRGDTTPK